MAKKKRKHRFVVGWVTRRQRIKSPLILLNQQLCPCTEEQAERLASNCKPRAAIFELVEVPNTRTNKGKA